MQPPINSTMPESVRVNRQRLAHYKTPPPRTRAVLPSDFPAATHAAAHKLHDARISSGKPTAISSLLRTLVLYKWRFGAIFASAIVAIAVAGMSIQLVTTESPSSTTQAQSDTAA